MSDFNALKFVADNAGLNIFKALEKAYEQGKADAEKEMHDNILRYRMPVPWKGEQHEPDKP